MTGFNSQLTHNEKGERLYRIQMETTDKHCYKDVEALIRRYIDKKNGNEIQGHRFILRRMRGEKND